jgi:hypothetical protein
MFAVVARARGAIIDLKDVANMFEDDPEERHNKSINT